MSFIAHPTAAQAAGGAGEERAEAFLAAHGLAIVARNYRTKAGEIDVIARDGPTLVFVEVRVRSPNRFGGALASITPRKQRRIVAAARQFLMRLTPVPPCRFDVIALEDDAPVWIRGAFDAG
ncbi:MAG TPA: YraN family protein [Usitatibacter sp.]|nr:YraN family protein [Usitatibacter sp.]